MGGDALFGYDGVFYTLFLLTPPRGGDVPVSHVARYHCHFYLRPRVGGDIVSMGAPSEERISTHAPAWGATRSSTPSWWSYGNFYSRPRMGGDTIL